MDGKGIEREREASSPKLKRKSSRAQLAGRVALGALALGFGIRGGGGNVEPIRSNAPVVPTAEVLTPFVARASENEDPSVTKLREEISNKFGIEINSQDELSPSPFEDFVQDHLPSSIDPAIKVIIFGTPQWNKEKLRLIEQILDDLPEDLYKPREDGEKLHVILTRATQMFCKAPESTSINYPRELRLAYNGFNTDNPLNSKYAVIHELAHLKTIAVCSGDKSFLTRIDEILGEDFDQAKIGFRNKIQEEAKQLGAEINSSGVGPKIDTMTPDEERLFILIRREYSLKNRKEFIAVAAESYFLGRSYFNRMYSFLPEEPRGKLYAFIKNQIFSGKEFPDYRTIITQ